MNRESLIELVYQRTDLDADVIERLTNNELREVLRMPPIDYDAPPPERKRRAIRPRAVPPKLVSFEFIDGDGVLLRRENFNNDTVANVKCGKRVQFEGRTVSASIVLHYLRTGERVARVPREVKLFRAVVRVGGKVKHLGRFATEAERDTAVFSFRLGVK
jgi:hypothetical protein